MSQRIIKLPVIFQKGAGVFLASPITQFQNNYGEIFSATRNTCKTRSILLGGEDTPGNINTQKVSFAKPLSELQIVLEQLKQKLLAVFPQEQQYIFSNIDRLKELVIQFYRALHSINVMSLVNQAAPDKNRILTMNFVGYEDWDTSDVNKNENQQLIPQFLMGTHRINNCFSKRLMVLIDNGGKPRQNRNLTLEENNITQGLLKFFSENNFPRDFDKDDRESEQFILDKNYALGESRNRFRLIHYIQGLFAAIMLMYIEESAENRGTIFDNIQRILNHLQLKKSWNKPEQQDAISFLIQETIKGTALTKKVNDNSIKILANSIYMQLSESDHVTQIEFVKFVRGNRKLAEGFFYDKNYFFVPISTFLKAYRNELRLAENDSVFEFLSRLEKYATQFETNQDMLINNFQTGIQNVHRKGLGLTFVDLSKLPADVHIKFSMRFDKETQSLLIPQLINSAKQVNNLSAESFKYMPIEKLGAFSPQEQYDIFFSPKNKNRRYKLITAEILKIISPIAISHFVLEPNTNFEELNNFVGANVLFFSKDQLQQISFNLLTPQNIETLLFNRLNDIAPIQIKQLDLNLLPENILHSILKEQFEHLTPNQFTNLNFDLLNEEEKFLILERHIDVLSPNQIQTFDLIKLSQSNPSLLQNLISRKRNHFAASQLIPLLSSDISYLNCLSSFKNEEGNREFRMYFSSPDRFALTKSILGKMSPELQLIYLICYPERIPNELKSDFSPLIENILRKPNEYSRSLISNLINSWPENLITPLLKDMDINAFPKAHLYDLFQKHFYSLVTYGKLNAFSIETLTDIPNLKHRFSILNTLLDYYLQYHLLDKIQLIELDKLNAGEIELIINKACSHLISAQIKNIELSQLSRDSILKLLGTHSDCLCENQVRDLNFSDVAVAKLIIEKPNLLQNLTVLQVQKINLSEIGDEAVKKLINCEHLISNNENGASGNNEATQIKSTPIYKSLSATQVAQINLSLLTPQNLTGFINEYAKILNEAQIQSLDLKGFSPVKIKIKTHILKSLRSAGKLNCLSTDQIAQIDIFNPKYTNDKSEKDLRGLFLNDLLLLANFARFYTNGQCKSITNATIPNLDLNNVNIDLLCEIFECFSTQQQMTIMKILAGENRNYKNLDRLKDKLSNINLNRMREIDIDLYSVLISNYADWLTLKQLMPINWQKDPNSKIFALGRFLDLLKLDSNKGAFLQNEKTITETELQHWPNEFKVALLNTRLLNGNSNFVNTDMRKYFVEAIKIMFQHSPSYLVSVEKLIKEWPNEVKDLIQELAPANFLPQTVETLLRNHLLKININTLQNLNLEQIEMPVINFALMHRANDFLPEQMAALNFSDAPVLAFHLEQLKKLLHISKTTRIEIIQPKSFKRPYPISSYFEAAGLSFTLFPDIFKNYLLLNRIGIFTIYELRSINLNDLNPLVLTKILDEACETFMSEQIQSIEIKAKRSSRDTPITDDNYAPIAAILLLNRAKDMTAEQIQNIDLSKRRWISADDNYRETNIQKEIEKRNLNEDAVSLLRKAHRFNFLSDSQLNRHIPFHNNLNIKEILSSNLESRITQELQEKTRNLKGIEGGTNIEVALNLSKLKQILSIDEYKRMVIAWGKMFSSEQIKQIPPEILNVLEPDFIEQFIMCFSKEQIQAIEIKAVPDSYNIKYGKYVTIAAILLLNRIEDMTREQIKNINFALQLIKDEVKKRDSNESPFSLLFRAHRLSDLSDNQLNIYLDFSSKGIIKEILDYNLENKVTAQLQELTKSLPNSDNKTKIERQLDLVGLKSYLNPEQYIRMIRAWKHMFSFEQLISCIMSFELKDLSAWIANETPITSEREISVGVFLYKFYQSNLPIEAIKSQIIESTARDRTHFGIRHNELYFFKCILIAQDALQSYSPEKISFNDIAGRFFEMFNDWELLNTQNHFEEKDFGESAFKITPGQFAFLIRCKGENCQGDSKIEFANRMELAIRDHRFLKSKNVYPDEYKNALLEIRQAICQDNTNENKELEYAK